MSNIAETIVQAVRRTGLDQRVSETHPLTWRQGAKFAAATNINSRRLGYSLMLTAIVDTPEAAQTLLISIRDLLDVELEDAA